MKHFVLFAFLVVSFLSQAQQAIDTNFNFQLEPNKTLSLYIPSSYDPGTPNRMMIGFHPFNVGVWNSTSWRDTLTAFAEANDLILMCPDGGSNGIVDDAIDTAFTSAMCDSMFQWYNIDTGKVYAMGFSVGGRATYTYSLNNPDKVAGFIPIGAAISGTSEVNTALQANAACKPIYIVHGSLDSPNTRYWPVRNALDGTAWLNSILMTGVNHTINFNNRNAILGAAFQWVDSLNCMQLTPDAGANDTICDNDSTQLGGDAIFGGSCPYTYSWSPNYAISSIAEAFPRVSPDSSVIYYVTVTDADGNSATDSVSIEVLDSPSLVVIGDTVICSGDSASLQVTGAASYFWSPSSSVDCFNCDVVQAFPSQSTTYSITGNGANGCDAQLSYALTVNALPQASIQPTAIAGCLGDTVDLTLNSASNLFGIAWSDSSALSCQCDTPSLVLSNTQLLSVSYSDLNGCENTSSKQVQVYPAPVTSLADTVFLCVEEATSVTAEVISAGQNSYLWSNGDTLAIAELSPFQSQYEFVTVTSDDGCSTFDTVWVQHEVLEASINSVFMWDLDSCWIFYSSSVSAGLVGTVTYEWFVDGQSVGTDSVYTYKSNGGFINANTVLLQVTSSTGCTDTISSNHEFLPCFWGVESVDEIGFKLFPNPADERVSLEFKASSAGLVSVLSLDGQLLLEERFSGTQLSLNVSEVPAGIYMIQVLNAGVVDTRMLEIQ